MTMKLITDAESIKLCEIMLEQRLKEASGVQTFEDVIIDVNRGTEAAKHVHYIPEIGLWYCRRLLTVDNKWWNSFGFDKPTNGGKISSFFEINVPLSGETQNQGLFVLEEHEHNESKSHIGKIHFLHRGARIAGMQSVIKEYVGERMIFKDKEYLYVGEITSHLFLNQIKNFAAEVKHLKEKHHAEKHPSTV